MSEEKTGSCIEVVNNTLNGLTNIAFAATILGGAAFLLQENAPRIAEALHLSLQGIAPYIEKANIVFGSTNMILGLTMGARSGMNVVENLFKAEEADERMGPLYKEKEKNAYKRFFVEFIPGVVEVVLGGVEMIVGRLGIK